VINRTADFQAEMAGWRHNLHAHSETAFEAYRTADIVARLRLGKTVLEKQPE
jgi:metal-dependent amidase/aminoacylase/carboxypeptidase family protein